MTNKEIIKEMNELRNNRRDLTISGWVAACNNLLKEYDEILNMEYCSRCQMPTVHDELKVQGSDALPNETEPTCIRCEMLGRNYEKF